MLNSVPFKAEYRSCSSNSCNTCENLESVKERRKSLIECLERKYNDINRGLNQEDLNLETDISSIFVAPSLDKDGRITYDSARANVLIQHRFTQNLHLTMISSPYVEKRYEYEYESYKSMHILFDPNREAWSDDERYNLATRFVKFVTGHNAEDHLHMPRVAYQTRDTVKYFLGLDLSDLREKEKRVILGLREELESYPDQKAFLDDVFFAGMLHDVGKLLNPASILNKKARLSKEEYQIIQEHPSLGASIIEPFKEIFPLAIEASTKHHIRVDGGGYNGPKEGLKVQIPIWLRILNYIDLQDAITTNRPYRKEVPFNSFIWAFRNLGFDDRSSFQGYLGEGLECLVFREREKIEKIKLFNEGLVFENMSKYIQ